MLPISFRRTGALLQRRQYGIELHTLTRGPRLKTGTSFKRSDTRLLSAEQSVKQQKSETERAAQIHEFGI